MSRLTSDFTDSPTALGLPGASPDQSLSEPLQGTVLSEQEGLAMAVRHAVDGLWYWDIRGNAVFISPRLGEMLGYPAAELSQSVDAFMALVHSDDRAEFEAAVAAHLTARRPFDIEVRLRHRNGSWRWFWDRGQAEWDADGTPVFMAGSLSDVTERRADRAAREASDARYRQLLDVAHDGICTTDAHAVITYANPRLLAMLGFEDTSLRGRSWFELLAPDEQEPARGRFARLGERKGDTRELTLRCADGGTLSVRKATSALLGADGDVQGALFIVSDLSEHRRAELSLRTSEARLASIIGSAMDAVITTDAAHVIVLANDEAARMFGYAPGEMLGLPLGTLMPERFRRAHHQHMHRFAHDGTSMRAMNQPSAAEGLFAIRKDGTEFPIEASISQVQTEEGRYFTVILRDVSTQRAAEAARARAVEALREREQRYALAAQATSHAIWEWDLRSHDVAWNGGAAAVLGHGDGDVGTTAQWRADHMHPEDRERVIASIHGVIDGAEAVEWSEAYRFRRADGSYAEIADRGYIIRDAEGTAVRMVGAMQDVTATRQLEDRLRQAQKMEAVGQLAGGIAHDFNNLLTIIAGNLEFLRADLDHVLTTGHPALRDLEQIADASVRAHGLVRQLLTFSRQQPVNPRRLQLGAVVAGAEQLLRRVIGEEIALAVHTADAGWGVEIDPGQLEQVLMNLAVNARDAMLTPLHGHLGHGGALTIEVDSMVVDQTDVRHWEGTAPGPYVRLRVRDTGHGMDARTKAHLFEPFFTTKEVGAGTGLGLATVFGIVRQAAGVIQVDTVLGRGTSFTILFPASDTVSVAEDAATEPAPQALRGNVLLVEDESAVRFTARRMLELQGFRVMEARHGADALLAWEEHRAEIDVVVSDVRMPELGGRDLVARLHAERPELAVVLMSGYSEPSLQPTLSSRVVFLPKPFTAQRLLRALGAAMDGTTG
jgi:two-component system, cell cycle sensor histidine kinase and response regulator CckA